MLGIRMRSLKIIEVFPLRLTIKLQVLYTSYEVSDPSIPTQPDV